MKCCFIKTIFTLSFLLVGCSPSHTVPLKPIKTEDKLKNQPLDFSNVTKFVFEPYCIKCHSATGGNQGDVNLETYEAVKPILRFIQDEVVSRRMPTRTKMPQDEIDFLVQWIAVGAPEAGPEE